MIISIYVVWFGFFIFPVISQTLHYIIDNVLRQSSDIFVNQVCVIGQDFTDFEMEALSMISVEKHFPIFVGNIAHQNCSLEENGLAILKNLDVSSITMILNNASQRQLSKNLWVIVTTNENMTAETIFSMNTRKFGIQVSILFISPVKNPTSELEQSLTQVLGTASMKVKFKDHGDLSQVNLTKVITDTRTNQNFNGVEFKVNFGEYTPYCIIEDIDELKISGAFPDAMKIVALHLNLTLKIQQPLPENFGNWAKQ
jgi:hypothetical protein